MLEYAPFALNYDHQDVTSLQTLIDRSFHKNIYIYIYLRSSTNCIIPLGSWIARIMSQSVAFALGWKNNDSIVFSHCGHDNAQREAHPLNGHYQISCCHNGTTYITEHASHPGALACRTRFFMMPISRHISFGLSILTP